MKNRVLTKFHEAFRSDNLEIYRALYTSVAEEMGIALRRTAFSPNIKERRDYSCAVFDQSRRVIAQGDHMPVHLGSMPMAVASALNEIDLEPGDVVALNDPFAGGTHLPDVTLVMHVGDRRTGKRGRGKGEAALRVLFPLPFPITLSPLRSLRRQPRASRRHRRRTPGSMGRLQIFMARSDHSSGEAGQEWRAR